MPEEHPWIHANVLTINAKGLNLIATEKEALELAARVQPGIPPIYDQPGRRVLRRVVDGDPRQFQNLQEWHLYKNSTSIEVYDGTTAMTVQLYDDGKLEQELRRAAATFRHALDVTANPGALESLRLNITMSTTEPPSGQPPESAEPVTHTYQTDNGLAFQHTIVWAPFKFTADDGEEATNYDLAAAALIGEPEVPGPNDLADVLIATYAAAAAFYLGIDPPQAAAFLGINPPLPDAT